MRRARWRRVPWLLLSCLCSRLFGPVALVSPSSDADRATQLWSSPTRPATARGHPGAASAAGSGPGTSDASTSADAARRSTPFSASTSPEQPPAVSQGRHAQGAQATQESQTTRPGLPGTDTVASVTAATSSANPSGHPASERGPLDTPTTGSVSVFSPTPSGKSHTTRAPTTEQRATPATPASPDTTLGTSSHASTLAPVTSGVSAAGTPGGQATSPATGTSPDATSAVSQTRQTRATETSGVPRTSKPASLLTDTTLVGTTATSPSPVIGRTTSGSAAPETFTSGETTALTPAVSSDGHTAPSSTQLVDTAGTPGTTHGTTGAGPGTSPGAISPAASGASTTGRPAGQSTSTSLSTSSQGTSSTSQMAQTEGPGTASGSEPHGSVSRVTHTASTVTSPPPSPTPNGHTSPPAVAHTLPPSSPIATFVSSTPVSDGHGTQTATAALAAGATEGPAAVSSGTPSDVTSRSPSTSGPTSAEALPTNPSSTGIPDTVTAKAVSPVGSGPASPTGTTQVPPSSLGISSEPTTGHPLTVQSVAATNKPTATPNDVSSSSNPLSRAASTLTLSDEPTSHPSTRTAPVTASHTGSSQATSSYALPPTPTSAVSPSSDADRATQLWSSPTRPATARGHPGAASAAGSGPGTSDASTSADAARRSTPFSASTSPEQPPAVSQGRHAQGAQATQESQTTRPGLPGTDTVASVTAATSSANPSGHPASERGPLDTPTTGSVSVFSPTPSGKSHTARAPTTEQRATPATPASPDTTLGTASHASTLAPVTSGVSAAGTPGGQATSPATGTSPDATSAVSQTRQTRATETSGVPRTSKPASLLTDTTLVGTTATSPSPVIGRTTSGSAAPETFTSGETTALTPAVSSDGHTAPSSTQLVDTAGTPGTTHGTTGAGPGTSPGAISPAASGASTTGRPAGQSTSTSLSTSSQGTSSTSQMAQTEGPGTASGSEPHGSVSRVTHTASTVTSPPPSPTPNGHTSPPAVAHTLPPSSPIATFASTPVSDGHGAQTATAALAAGATEGPTAVSSGTPSDATSRSPSTSGPTSAEALPTSPSSTGIPDTVTAKAVSPVGSGPASPTGTTQVPPSSLGISSEPTTGHPLTVQSVAATNKPTATPNDVSSSSNPLSRAASTLTLSDEPTSHPSTRTAPVTASHTGSSQATSSYALPPTPTSAVSPSSDADRATQLWSSPTRPATARGHPGAASAAGSGPGTSDASTSADAARRSTPFSASTSPEQPPAVSQGRHAQGAQATQESQTTRPGLPGTDTVASVTAATSSANPSGHPASERGPLDTPTTGSVSVFSPTPSGKSHTARAPTTEQRATPATPASPDTTLGTASHASTLAPVTSGVSAAGTPGGQATSPATGTSPDATSAVSQTRQTRATETSGVPRTSKPASLLTDTTLVGTTATSPSPVIGQTTSGSAAPETFTSGETTALTPAVSSDGHTAPSSTQLVDTAGTPGTTHGTTGAGPGTSPGAISPAASGASTTGRPAGQSTSTSLSTSSQGTSSTSQMAQTEGPGTASGSEPHGSVSRVTHTASTVTSPPPSPTPNGHTSPPAVAHTLPPSSPIATFASTPVSDGHGAQTATAALAAGATEGPAAVSSGTPSDATSRSPSTSGPTSAEALPTSPSSTGIPDTVTAKAVSPVGSGPASPTGTTQVPPSSLGISSEPTTGHPLTVQSVAATNKPTATPNDVSSSSNPLSRAASTLTLSDEPTSHPSTRTAPVTASHTGSSQATSSYALPPTPTSAVSPSSDADRATQLWSSPTRPATARGHPGAASAAGSGPGTSDASTSADAARRSTPFSASTSPEQPPAVSQGRHAQGAQATQESQTTRPGLPGTDTVASVTAATSSANPSGHPASERGPLDTPTTGSVSVFSPTPSGKSHTARAPTTEQRATPATPASPDTTLGTASHASTLAPVTSGVSAAGTPGGQATSPATGTSPDATSAVSQTRQTRATETSGVPRTSKPASLLTDTTLVGTTATSPSPVIGQTTSGSAAPETFTSGETTALTPAVSSDGHTAPSSTQLVDTAGTPGTTHGTTGAGPGTSPGAISPAASGASTTGRPAGQSTSTSLSTSSQGTSSTSQMAQTEGPGTASGSEPHGSVSRVTHTASTVTSPPPSPTPNGHTSPPAVAHTLPPSSPIATFASTPVSDGHGAQTATAALAAGATEGPTAVSSGTPSDATSRSPSTSGPTSAEALPTSPSSTGIPDTVTAKAVSPVGSGPASPTGTTQVPPSSLGISSEPTTGHPLTVQSVAATNKPTATPNDVSSSSNPLSRAASTLTLSDEPTSHPSTRTAPVTASHTGSSQATSSYALPPTPTSAVSPSSDADRATQLWSSPTRPATARGHPGAASAAGSGPGTSDASTSADAARRSTPFSASTSPEQPPAVSQGRHAQGAQATQESQTTRPGLPGTDTVASVTAATSSANPSGHPASERGPLDTPTTGSVSVFSPTPSGKSHTARAPTTEQRATPATPASPDTTLGTASHASTLAPVTSGVSAAGTPGGQATSPATGTSPDATSAVSQTRQTRATETSGVPRTSKPASLLTDTTLVGTTATSPSPVIGQTTSGSAAPETFTSGETTALTPAVSSDGHTAPSSTQLVDTAGTPGTTHGTTGAGPGTSPGAISPAASGASTTGRPAGQSTSTSLSTSSQGTSSTSQMAQTEGPGTASGSEPHGSVSRVTHTASTVTSPPPSPTPNGHTSPPAVAHTLPPSSPIATFASTPVSDGHGAQTATAALAAGATEGPAAVSSGTPSDATSRSPSTSGPTSAEALPTSPSSTGIPDTVTAKAVSPVGSGPASPTGTTQVPPSSLGISSEPTTGHPLTVQSVAATNKPTATPNDVSSSSNPLSRAASTLTLSDEPTSHPSTRTAPVTASHTGSSQATSSYALPPTPTSAVSPSSDADRATQLWSSPTRPATARGHPGAASAAGSGPGTSDASTSADAARRSTPFSASTSPEQPPAVSQGRHAQGAQATQESQTTRPGLPGTDTVASVTAATSSANPSGHPASERGPLDTPTTGSVSVFSPTPSGKSHTARAPTTEQRATPATPASPDTTLGTASHASTLAPVTSGVSAAGTPGGQATSPATGTSPDATSAVSQTRQTRATETSGVPRTSKPASLLTDTTLVGTTATSPSPVIGQTTSGSAAPETFTSGETTALTPAVSSDGHTAPSSTQLVDTAGTPGTTHGTTGAGPGTSPGAISPAASGASTTGRPAGQSTSTSLSTSSQGTSSTSQMAQTEGPGTASGSEPHGSVSRVTHTASTVTSPPPSPTPNGHTSPPAVAHTLPPSSPIATFASTPVSDGHGAQTATAALAAGATEGPAAVSSGTPSDATSRSPSTSGPTSAEALPTSPSSTGIPDTVTAKAVSPVGSGPASPTGTTQVPPSSLGISSEPTTGHPLTVQSVAATNKPTATPNDVSSSSNPLSRAASTLTLSDEPTSHPSTRTAPVTASHTGSSQATSSYALPPTPTSAVSPSSDADRATQLWSSPTRPATARGHPGAASAAGSGPGTSDASTSADAARRSTPFSASTSPEQPPAVSQGRHAQGAQATQESQTTRPGLPGTDTVASVTAATSSANPSGHPASERGPLDTPTTGSVSVFSPTPSGKSHTARAPTTEQRATPATPASPDTTLGTASHASTLAPVTSGVSAAGTPGGQATSPATGTSPDATSAVSQTRQTRATETSGVPRTSKPASLLTDTTLVGTTATSPSPVIGQTTSGSAAPETFTSGETTALTPAVSSDGHTAPSSTQLVDTAGTPGTTHGTTGAGPGTSPGAISPAASGASTTGRPAGQSTSTSLSTSSQGTSSTSQMAQTEGPGTASGSEPHGSVSRVTHTASTVTSPPPSPTPNGHTSPPAVAHTLPPSSPIATFASTPVSDGHGAQTATAALAAGATEGPTAVSSGTPSDATSRSPSTSGPTSAEALPTSPSSTGIPDTVTAKAVSPVGSGPASPTGTTQVPPSSLGISSEPTTGHPLTVQSVAATNKPTATPNDVSSSSNPLSRAASTLTLSDEPTSHPSTRTAPVTASHTGSSQATSSYALPPTPTSAVSPSSDADRATQLWSSPTRPATARGHPGAASAAGSGPGTSDASTSADAARRSTPFSASTSPEQPPAVSQGRHAQGAQATQESQTTRPGLPGTDTVASVTAATSSANPSGHPASERGPLDTPTTGSVSVFSPTPSGKSHTARAPTTEQRATPATPASPDTTLGTASHASTLAPVTSGVSAAGTPGGQATSPATGTSPDATSAVSQTRQTRATETSGVPRTSKPASLLTDTTLVGTTATSPSPVIGQTTSGSAAPETFTSGETTALTPAVSSDGHTAPSSTQLVDTAGTPGTTHGTTGAGPGTSPGAISPAASGASTTGRPAGQSTSTSLSTSSQGTSSTSQMAQTEGPGTASGSEPHGSVSRVTHTASTVTSPPPSPTPNGHTSPPAVAHTLPPSSPIATFASTPVSDGHGAQTATATLAAGATEGPTAVSSGTPSDATSRSPSTSGPTSAEALPTSPSSTGIPDTVTAKAVSPVGSGPASPTGTTQVPPSSLGISSEPTTGHPLTVQSVAATNKPTATPNDVSSSSNPLSRAASTLTLSDEPTSHPSTRTAPVTASHTGSSQATSSYALPPTPTSAVSPSSDADRATQLWSSPTRPATARGHPGAASAAGSGPGTSDASTSADAARRSTPFSASTSPEQPPAVSQGRHAQGAQATQESQTTRPGLPGTDTVASVTAATSSANPSGHPASERGPLDTPTTGSVSVFSPTPSGKSHTTRAPTTEQRVTPATPASPDTTLGTASHASTLAPVTSGVSAAGTPGGQATSPATGTSPDATSAVSQTLQTRATETSGVPRTSKPASLLTDTTLVGTTATSPSPVIGQTTSGSAAPETFTSGETTALTPAVSSDGHTAPSSTQLVDTAGTPGTTHGTMGAGPGTSPGAISPAASGASTTGRPAGQSTSTSLSTSSQGTSSTSQMAQTEGPGTASGSEPHGSVSRVTHTASTVTSPPPSPTPNGHTSPPAVAHTLPPSSPIATFASTPVSDGHGAQTATAALAAGATEGPTAVSSGTPSDATSRSPSTSGPTSAEALPTSPSSTGIPDTVTAKAVSPVGSGPASPTGTTQVPPSSLGISSEPTTGHPLTVQSVAATNKPTATPNDVSSSSNPLSRAASTLTLSDEPTSHPSTRTAPVTASHTGSSQATSSYALPPTPTSAVSPSSDADRATQLWSSPTRPATARGHPGAASAAGRGPGTSDASTSADAARRSTPFSASTSPEQPPAVSQGRHAQGAQATQESQTKRPGLPGTDTVASVTAATSSANPSGHPASERGPLDTPTTGSVSVFSPTPSGKSHTARAPTTEQQVTPATPASPDTTLGTASHASTLAPVTSGVSAAGTPGGQATSPATGTSPDATSAVSQTRQTRATETSGVPRTSKPASLLTDTTLVGTTATSPSPVIGQTTSGSAAPETFTSGETTALTPAVSSDGHTAPSSTQLVDTAGTPGTTHGTTGAGPGTSPGAISPAASGASTTGRPAGQSTSTSLSTSSQGTSSTSQMAQTEGPGTASGSEPHGSVSRVTHTASTVTSPPPSPTPNGHTSPPAVAHTLPPSSPIATFASTPVSDGHGAQTATAALAAGATEGPTAVSFGTPSDATSRSPSTSGPTSAEALPTSPSSTGIPDTVTAKAVSPVGSGPASPTGTTQVPPSSLGISSEPTTGHPLTVMSVASATSSTTLPTHVWSSSHLTSSALSTPTPSFQPSSYSSVPTAPGMTTISPRTDSKRSTVVSVPVTSSLTLKSSTPRTSAITFSKPPPVPVKPEKGVSLFPYGSSVGDHEFVKRTVDFTSPLFKPQIGFPFGFSLRDSLYFTDNGQIIFPESDHENFSYPNPPFRRFTGWDPVALVAPFWDDADFSSHRGTIFYQEYETLHDDHHPLVQQVESWIEKFTNASYYKARWTLKITWANAPAYPAHRIFGTNTFQAILSTDGSRSYALFLYQSGGMQWDVTKRPRNSVLMGFSSGDGYFQNSPLTLQPAWKKYRPDQFLNSHSGLQGLQVYTLHGEERPNYRLKCLQWLERQPQWPGWGWNWSQISCPCSWHQARWDLRFQPISTGWWGLGSRQLCSFSSRRGGVCCSYGPWGELREGRRVQSLWQSDQELEPQNWCCRWNDKPFFCALYQQRRPRIGCAGYMPPRLAWMSGDPHFTTLDGANFTFNGLGDFLLVRAWDRNSSFLLLGRTAQTGTAKATNFIAFAAQYNSSHLGPITVQWSLQPNDTMHILVNNHTVTFETNHEDAEGQEIFNTTGVILTRSGSLVTANFDGMVTISVLALFNILHASSSLPEEYQSYTEGLLGVWNGSPDDDFKMPNGSIIPQGSTEETIFHYGMTYQYPPSIMGQDVIEAYKGQTKWIQYTSNSENITFTLRNSSDDFTLFGNGTLLWTPTTLEPFTLEILARNTKNGLSSVLRPKTMVCNCSAESQCLFNQTTWVGNSSLEVAACQCDGDTYGRYCERSKSLCEEQCFPGVNCNPEKGCEACPPNTTGDGRHCALALENFVLCQNKSCPVNYCYNHGHCYISQTQGCEPTCTCPPAFTDTRCFLAGNDFTPTTNLELPSRVIQLLLSEEENASIGEVNASVAYRLGNLEVRAFLLNSLVERVASPTPASGSSLQRWKVISEFQYRPSGPVIDFLNNRLLSAVVEAFLLQAPQRTWRGSEAPRSDVLFHPVSRGDVRSEKALNVSMLETYFRCNGYKGYSLVYSPQSGFTCKSPCSAGYCEHGGLCQHLPDGPRCSCVPFSIYAPWGEHCEHLSMKLGAFFGILFGALGALLVLGAGTFVVLRFISYSSTRYTYALDSES